MSSKKPRTDYRKFLPALAFISVIALAGSWFVIDPAGWFRLKSVEITGSLEHISPEEIRKLVVIGSPFVRIDTDSLRKEVEANDWVRSAAVRRVLPNGLLFHIQEHQEIAIVETGRKYLLSEEGIIFKEADENDLARGLPTVRGLEKDKTPQDSFRKQVAESITVIKTLQYALEPYGLGEIHWTRQGVSLVTKRYPFEIVLGEAPFEEKLIRLVQVFPDMGNSGRHPQKILVGHGEGVIVRYGKGTEKK